MTKRRRDILLLLWSLDDFLPSPQGALHHARGLAPSERRSCPDCGHLERPGWIAERVRGVERPAVPCVTCGGKPEPSGAHGRWLQRDGGRGWVAFDPMDADRAPVQTVGVDARPTRPARMVVCDACDGEGVGQVHLRDPERPELGEWRERCRYCGGAGKRAVTVFDLELERERGEAGLALEAAIDRRTLAGSYHELEQALQVLPRRWRRAVMAVHVRRTVREHDLDQLDRALLAASLAALDFLMPDKIRVPGAVRAAWKMSSERAGRTRAVGKGAGKGRLEERDREVRRLIRQGKPSQWVAGEYGLSVSTVNRIAAGSPSPS